MGREAEHSADPLPGDRAVGPWDVSTRSADPAPPDVSSGGGDSPHLRGHVPASGYARARAALSGVLAAALALAIAALLAAILNPSASPLLAVGSAFVDLVPQWLERGVIALFGTSDKLVLFLSMGVVAFLLAALAGLASLRDRRLGTAVVVVLGLVTVLAAVTRASGGAMAAVPSLVGFGVGALVLQPLVDAARRTPGAPSADGTSRRSFVTLATATAVGAGVAGIGARLVTAGGQVVTSAREAITLPTPVTPAAVLPAGAETGIDGLAPFVTPNAEFYRIDTALRVPQLDPAQWSLRIHGMVENEVTITWDELLAEDLVESWATLACVSNEVGGTLIGNARWLGLPTAALLARAGVEPGADMVLSSSSDGFTAGTPIEALADPDRGSLLAVGMNGEPLPVEHGFPARLVVPGLYGYVSATKWVVDLEVTRFADAQAYWTRNGWSERGPIKTGSRIDVPLRPVPAGTVAIAGVAWAQTRGISAVEVQIDDGGWAPATLAAVPNADTWVQWVYPWEGATAGDHRVTVRATDGDGETQTSEQVGVVPDGATGWDSLTVQVT